MTAANQQLVDCYDVLGMSPEQIAETEGLSLAGVKAVLFQFSGKYREDTKQNKSLDFSEEDLDQANAVIKQVALYAEDEGLRFRAARYIRDDKKGRKDGHNALKSLNINIAQYNTHLAKAMASLEQSRQRKLVNGNGGPQAPVQQSEPEIEQEVIEA